MTTASLNSVEKTKKRSFHSQDENSEAGLSYTRPRITKKNLKRHPNYLRFNSLLKNQFNVRSTINLDWLSVTFFHPENDIKEPENENESMSNHISETISLVYKGNGGNKQYKYIWEVHYKGELFAKLLSHSRNLKIIKANICKVDFENHLLYSSEKLWLFYDELVNSMGLRFKSIIRVDIAMDNLNYLVEFLNFFAKQTHKNKIIELLGNPEFKVNILDRPSMLYQSFRIGSTDSPKYITIYNKSLDIVHKQKEYIHTFWKKNGIIEKVESFEMLHNRIKDTKELVNIPGYKNVFRCELRLKGKALNQIDNFSIDMLKTPDGQISIMKFMCNKFFEAVWLFDNSNVSRGCNEKINLIPFEKFNIVPLQKVKLTERTDLYKTKLSISKNIRQLFTGKLDPESAFVFEILQFDIEQFNLWKWFKMKYERQWIKEFSKLNSNQEHIDRVNELIQSLFHQEPIEHEDQF